MGAYLKGAGQGWGDVSRSRQRSGALVDIIDSAKIGKIKWCSRCFGEEGSSYCLFGVDQSSTILVPT
jgi:hypothetical protein